MADLEERMKRRSRSVPPTRRPPTRRPRAVAGLDPPPKNRATIEFPDSRRSEPPEARAMDSPEGSQPAVKRSPGKPKTKTATAHHNVEPVDSKAELAVGPNEPTVTVAGRVRQSLDIHFAQVVIDLRANGLRSSKAEMLEMLLWELPGIATLELQERLRRFRSAAPRT